MPIRKELRHFYGPEWRNVTRPRILERAGNKCEICGVPNHVQATRAMGWWTIVPWEWWFRKWVPDQYPEIVWHATNGHSRQGDNFPREICRQVYIVLTVAHLNHISGDDRDENLKAMCQWCHLEYDRQHHRESRGTRKDQSRPLLQLADKPDTLTPCPT
jgi:hypothetical protein